MVPRGWSSPTYKVEYTTDGYSLTEMQDMSKTCMPHHKQHEKAGNAFLPWQERDFIELMKILIVQNATLMHCKNVMMSRYFSIKTTTTAVYMRRNGHRLHCTNRSDSRLIVEQVQ